MTEALCKAVNSVHTTSFDHLLSISLFLFPFLGGLEGAQRFHLYEAYTFLYTTHWDE